MISFLLAFALTLSAQAEALVSGTISDLALTVKYGTAAGLDQFDADGTYTLGAGSNGFSLPSDVVIVSFDGGKFSQVIPANSFVVISGGFRFTSTNPGIKLLKIMNNGTFQLQVRNTDLTGVDTTELDSFTIAIGDEFLSGMPNSIPVARIEAPLRVEVGTPVALDGSQSSDYNLQAQSFSWTLVSKPEGSTASLTSSNASSSGFTPDKRGFYSIKLVTNDGISDGVPALVTIEATGGPADPAPAPSPDNGFILLSADKPDYIVGESAILSVHVNVGAGNATNEYFYRAYLDEAPISLTELTETDLSYTSAIFSQEGAHTLRVELFLQNKSLARQLADSFAYYQSEIAKIDAALVHETDPAVIAQLNAQKAEFQAQLAKISDELEKNRTKLGASPELSFVVNP